MKNLRLRTDSLFRKILYLQPRELGRKSPFSQSLKEKLGPISFQIIVDITDHLIPSSNREALNGSRKSTERGGAVMRPMKQMADF